MAELETLLAALDWPPPVLARRLNASETTVRRWCRDPRYPPPERVLAWLRGLVAHLRANPPPPAVVRRPAT